MAGITFLAKSASQEYYDVLFTYLQPATSRPPKLASNQLRPRVQPLTAIPLSYPPHCLPFIDKRLVFFQTDASPGKVPQKEATQTSSVVSPLASFRMGLTMLGEPSRGVLSLGSLSLSKAMSSVIGSIGVALFIPLGLISF